MTTRLTNCTILLEGAHRVGKGTSVNLISERTGHLHTLIDRGWASNWAFCQIFDRPCFDLDRAVHDYFANPSAYVVHYSMGAEDYEADRSADAQRVAQWIGQVPSYPNRRLALLVEEALCRAVELGYGDRILSLVARESDSQTQAQAVIDWLQVKQTKASDL